MIIKITCDYIEYLNQVIPSFNYFVNYISLRKGATYLINWLILDELTRYFECGIKAPKEAIDNTKAMLIEYQNTIKTIRMQYQWENDKCIAMDEQLQKVRD